MKASLMVCLVFCWATNVWGQQGSKGLIPTYELYSWQDPQGGWNFCLLYTTNRQKTAAEVFNPKTVLHGSKEIERKISKLPKRSRIVWFEGLTLSGKTVEGTERLKYPPKEVVDEVKRWAAKREVQVLGPEDDGR